MGHLYLTKFLLPLLTATTKNDPHGSMHIIHFSSLGHYMMPLEGIRWSMLKLGDDFLVLAKKIGALKLVTYISLQIFVCF